MSNPFNNEFNLSVKEAEELLLNMISSMIYNNSVQNENELLIYIKIINQYNKDLQQIVENIID